MVVRLYIFFSLFLLFSCSKEDEQKSISEAENAFCAEQSAFDYFINELVNKDSLFYVQDDDGVYFELTSQTFLEDNLFVDGLFFWKKIYASNEVTSLSEPYHDSLLLYVIAPGMLNKDELKEAEEFIADFKSKKNMRISTIQIDIPSTISVVDDDYFEKKYLDNSLLLRVKTI